ncbi:MAG: DUF881 domain-containing protein [Armatimonadetes bacterium]|nr:DUF881 domain-containing protein [Armatimonadota bacterium]MDW8026915.1 DUF881 domain-containing protein [Armatimonadota bacterium]
MRQYLANDQRFAVVLVGLTLGLLIGLQVRTLGLQRGSVGTSRVNVLVERLLRAQDEIEKLREEVDKLRQQISDYEKAMAEGRAATQRMASELNNLRVLAGLTKVRGPGVIIWLTDASKPNSPEDPSSGIVHDTDLLMLVNELRNAGAEAIAINNQRVVSTTAIRCVGNLITVNGVTISPPYEVSAIGNPNKLKEALTMPGGIVEQLTALGIPLKIYQRQDVIIPSLSVTPRLDLARPSEK